MTRALNRLKTRPTRAGAFVIHLLVSLIIFSSLVAMMILYWFPGDLFFIDGGWQGLKLVAMVDLVLGPALTLILFKPGKPNLILDMSMVATIQIAALVYGFYTLHQQRTVAIVYAEKGFNTLSARDNLVADKEILALSGQPQPLPAVTLLKVPLLLSPIPEIGGFGKILADVLNGYPGPQERSDQFVPLEEHHDAIRADALELRQLAERGALHSVEQALKKRSLKPEDVEFYKFKARFASGIAIFDPETMQIIDFVPNDYSRTSPSEPSF